MYNRGHSRYQSPPLALCTKVLPAEVAGGAVHLQTAVGRKTRGYEIMFFVALAPCYSQSGRLKMRGVELGFDSDI
jgi:hypothetical protein